MSEIKQQIPIGYKLTDLGIIPEDWDIKSLKDIAVFRRGSFPQPYGLPKWYDDIFGLPFVQVYDVDNNFKLKNITKRKISKEGACFSVFAPKGTIILTIQGSIGRIALTQYDAYIDRTLLIFEDFKQKIDKKYFLYIVFQLFQKEKKLAPGGIIKTITKDVLSNFSIQLPTIEEQNRIATVLSDMDKLIAGLENLIEKKKMIKQGAMQSLLSPKEGWEVKRLGDVCFVRKGQLITKDLRVEGTIPVIAGGKQPAYFHNKANRYGKTITISASGANAGYVSFHNYPIFASDCSTIEEGENYNIEYIFFLLQLLQEIIYSKQTGGAQPHIHPRDLNPLEIPFPPTIEEQEHIANILSDMDQEIEQLENKKRKYEAIKQGAMQQLLIGKIRLLNK